MLQKVANPIHRFSREELEWLEYVPTIVPEVFEEEAKSILSENRSPDLGFRWSLNPYRGCFHACAYCYARPSHQYIDFGAGTDFSSKLVVKKNAASLLEARFLRRSWAGEAVVFSGNTDCYQPLELKHKITRACLEVCVKYRNPVGIITKGAIIQRDIELLRELAQHNAVHVTLSIPFSDSESARAIEPHAPSPETRFRTMRTLSDAGIPVSLSLSPLIPGLNDSMIPEIIARAAEAGAQSAFCTLLRLPQEVQEIFAQSLDEHMPQRKKKILNAIKEMRGGSFSSGTFGTRFSGKGSRWEATRWIFQTSCEKFGISYAEERDISTILHSTETSFCRPKTPSSPGQLSLFNVEES